MIQEQPQQEQQQQQQQEQQQQQQQQPRKNSFSSLPPVIFHKYEIEKQLEEGVFGEVLKGCFKKSSPDDKDAPVTIRTFRQSHKSMDELDLSEIEIISQLENDNIVRIFDVVWNISAGGVEMYLVYQFCNCGDLSHYINTRGRMNELQLQGFLRQMVQGMLVLRKHGIVHRDLKPSTILVEEEKDGRITFKIADMGLTKLFFDAQEGIAFGDCPPFVAPEVLKSSSSSNFMSSEDSKIDLWSLGVLALFCLGGDVPFAAATTMADVKESDVATLLPKGATHELVDIVLSLVKQDPHERLDFTGLTNHLFLKSLIWFASPYRHSLPCSSQVTSLCCDKELILCGLETGLIEIFDRKGFSLKKRLDFHRKTVSALAANHEIIVSGSQDTTIAVWGRGDSFEKLQVLYHHRNTVIGIEIIGSSAYSACLDGTHKAFSIDYKKLYARKNGFGQRRYSISEHSNEEFREDLDFVDDRSGKSYPSHWRDHDHMHTVAGIIVMLVYVAEDNEFRPFHVLSSRAFNSLKPQLTVRLRDDGNEHFVRKLTGFDSHVRQVQKEGDQLFLLHWDGRVTLFSVKEMLSQRPNEELNSRTLVEKGEEGGSILPTWFCVGRDALAYYTKDRAHLLEYKL